MYQKDSTPATGSKPATVAETGLPRADAHVTDQTDALRSHWRRAGMADNTVAALASSTRIFNAWCRDRQIAPTGQEPTPYYPTAPETVALFAHQLAFGEWTTPRDAQDGGRKAKSSGMKPATVARHVAMIAKAHKLADFPSPSTSPIVTDALKAIRRTKRTRQDQAAPITRDRLGLILDHLDHAPADEKPPARLRRLRDAAVLTTAFSACLRESEIAALETQHVYREDDGTGVVEIEVSKTDQEGEGDTRFMSRLAMDRLKAWTDAAQIDTGPLFVPVKGSTPARNALAMHPREIGRIFKRRAMEAGIEDADQITGHSTRVGAAQTAAAHGAGMVEIQRMGGWKSARMPAHYTRRQSVKESAAAKIAAAYGD